MEDKGILAVFVLTSVTMTFSVLPSLAQDNDDWDSQFNAFFSRSCDNDQVFKQIESIHENGKSEDRRWKITCGNLPEIAELENCGWGGYVNGIYEILHYHCPGDQVLMGMQVEGKDKDQKDRLFEFQCCNIATHVTHSCKYEGGSTVFQNNFDKILNYTVPDGYVITGITSVYNNKYFDRKYTFEICKVGQIAVLD